MSKHRHLLPCAVESEKIVLGSALVSKAAIGIVAEVLVVDDFYVSSHGDIYSVLVEMFSSGASIDLVGVDQRLRDRGKNDAAEILVEISDCLATDQAIEAHCETIRDKATVRRIAAAAGDISRACDDRDATANEISEIAEQKIFDACEKRVQRREKAITECLPKFFENMERYTKREKTGISYGFSEIDQNTGGARPGELIIIAGRPSMGKSALALSMALKMAVDQRTPLGYLTLEMHSDMVTERALCGLAGVSMFMLRTGYLPKRGFQKISEATGPLSDAQIYIDDSPQVTIAGLKSKIRRMVSAYGIRTVFIDHIGLMTSKGENRTQEMGRISRGLKMLAMEFEMPIFGLSQLSRESAKRANHRPVLSDLRDSGDIEQDADVVLFVHREEVYSKDPADNGKAEILCEKQRNGPLFITQNIAFDKESVMFREATEGM